MRWTALFVAVAVVVAPFAAVAEDTDREPIPGRIHLLEAGKSLDLPGYWIDEDRFDYYVGLRLDNIDLDARLAGMLTEQDAEDAYVLKLEARVKHLESPARQPAVYLAVGFVGGVAMVVLSALLVRWASGGFDGQ